jgi:Zn/Cd-binding protein ZinT
MTPLYARRIEELTMELEGVKAELKVKNDTLDSIRATLLSVYPMQRKDEVQKLKKQLAQKDKEMAEFKEILQKALKTK